MKKFETCNTVTLIQTYSLKSNVLQENTLTPCDKKLDMILCIQTNLYCVKLVKSTFLTTIYMATVGIIYSSKS